MEFMNKGLEALECKIMHLEKECETSENFLNLLGKHVTELQINTRSSASVLRNVPHKDRETVDEVISTVTQIRSSVNTLIQKSGIRDIYRIPGKPGTSKSI